MDKILIVGAKGMLGQALVRAFHDAEIFAWDRDECDITNRAMVAEKIGALKPTLIINAAAYNDVDGTEQNVAIANRVNGEAVGYLAEAAVAVGATFVHYSTDYVFDGTKKEGYREDDKPNPISLYGKSKLFGEQKITNYKLPITDYLIRTSRLFGAPGSGKKSFVDLILERAQQDERVEVVDEEFSSPTYVEDLAQRTREIIEQEEPSGIYHVTNSGVCTWYEFAQEIFRQNFEVGPPFGGPTSEHKKMLIVKPVPASRFPRPAKRPAYSQLLNTKLPPMRPWQEALCEYLKLRL